MGKKAIKYNSVKIREIFNDLDNYRKFCVKYGYIFREEDLYNMRRYPFQQFAKFQNGKNFKDQLTIDYKRYGVSI
jgi:hypothetical protein